MFEGCKGVSWFVHMRDFQFRQGVGGWRSRVFQPASPSQPDGTSKNPDSDKQMHGLDEKGDRRRDRSGVCFVRLVVCVLGLLVRR